MTASISDNKIIFLENGATPDTPPSGSSLLYPNTTPVFSQIDDTGTTTSIVSSIDVRDRITGVSLTDQVGLFVLDEMVGTENDLTFYTFPIPTRRRFVAFDPSRIAGNFLGGYGYTVYSTVSGTSYARFKTPTNNGVSYGIKPNLSGSIGRTHWMDSANNLYFYANLSTDTSISNVIYYIGVASKAMETDDIGSTQGVYFRYSVSASDTNWQGIVHASSANRTVQDLGVAVTSSTVYKLSFNLAANGVRFYVNGTYITEVAYPTGFGGVSVGTQFTVQTTDTNSQYLTMYQIYLEGDA